MPAKTNQIKSFSDLLNVLRGLDKTLPKDQLDHFVVFNRAYIRVTEAIQQAAQNDYFKDPKFVESFTICFADYYLKALNEIKSGGKNLPSTWQRLNRLGRAKRLPQSGYLLLGARAHIHSDLPHALLEDNDASLSAKHLKDLVKVDRLLMKSGHRILDSYQETSRPTNFVKKRLKIIYYYPTMYTILAWRIQAWHKYRLLKKDLAESPEAVT